MTDHTERLRIQGASRAFGELLRCLHLLHGPTWVELDLSMAQFKTLMLVAATGGLTGRDLAQRLGVGPSAVTPLVDQLVRHGYVHREEDAADRRVCWTRPTAAGLALFERVQAAGREHLEHVLMELSPDDLERVESALQILRAAAERRLTEVRGRWWVRIAQATNSSGQPPWGETAS